ncbi:hypothetical protein CEXT_437231 [Caerostris extrusa]|uniref:Uncharacterized protein n=1 Tax=Caerostris extrusa TaxID=172846 RepID=A0AAV4UJF5_CAEEX|nr:hypothetical protein CEXT_437231 [Caerostris extrusa]
MSSPLDNLRHPLEQQLMDIMRTSMDGQDHYKGSLIFEGGFAMWLEGFVAFGDSLPLSKQGNRDPSLSGSTLFEY